MTSHYLKKKNTDSDYAKNAKRICKDFEYLKSDTLLVAVVFENFRKMCLEMYELDPAKFLLAPGLTWQVAFKKTKVILELLSDIDMLLMIEKWIRARLCHSINR